MRLASAWESHYEFRLEPFNSASLARYFHPGIFTSVSSVRNLLSRAISGF